MRLLSTKLFKKTAAVLAASLVMMFSTSIVAFAATEGNNATISEYLSSSTTVSGSVSSRFTVSNNASDPAFASGEYRRYDRTVNGTTTYYYILASDEADAANIIIQAKKNSQASDDVKDITGGLNIKADTDTAVVALSGFTPIISTALGIMVVLISIGMTIFSAFDLCYIAFPVFRNKCEEAKQTGQGVLASNKQNKQTGETKLRFVSDDAQYAVAAAETVQTGKNPFAIYFTKRILSYIILAILLFILLTGNITIFTELALKLVSGILELISGI